MMTIGEFAQFSGLTVKALRFYDQTGLLPPARVHELNGYRYYAPEQLRTAAAVSVLRTMGLPLADVSEAVAAPDRTLAIIDAYAERLHAERERQDRLLAEGRSILHGYDSPAPAEVRTRPEQPWVGLAQTIDPSAGDEEVSLLNEQFNAFFARLHELGLNPASPRWLTFRADGITEEGVRALWCIPVDRLPNHDLGSGTETGVLPKRQERVVRLAPDAAMSMEFPAPHPGLLSVWDGEEVDAPVRQAYVDDGEQTVIEFITDLPLPAAQ